MKKVPANLLKKASWKKVFLVLENYTEDKKPHEVILSLKNGQIYLKNHEKENHNDFLSYYKLGGDVCGCYRVLHALREKVGGVNLESEEPLEDIYKGILERRILRMKESLEKKDLSEVGTEKLIEKLATPVFKKALESSDLIKGLDAKALQGLWNFIAPDSDEENEETEEDEALLDKYKMTIHQDGGISITNQDITYYKLFPKDSGDNF